MFLRPSEGTGRLLGCRFLPVYKARRIPPLLHLGHNVPARFKSTSSEPPEDPEDTNLLIRRYKANKLVAHKAKKRARGEKVPLDVNALGKPGEILLIPHREPRRRKEPKSKTNDTETAKDDTEDTENTEDGSFMSYLFDELDTAEKPLEESGVERQFDDFRSAHPPGDKLNVGDWEQLRSKIQSSFSFRQLLDYVERHVPEKWSTIELEPSDRSAVTGGWKPGTSPYLQSGSRLHARAADRVAAAQDLKGKQVLAETVLRDCWQLGVVDEVGQLDILVHPHSIALFENARHFSLQELASLHDAKIDISRSLGLIRVTGTQRSCESVNEVIQDTYTRIRSEEFLILPPGVNHSRRNSPISNQSFLDWINETYSVNCKKADSSTVKMAYFTENQEQAQKARRTLNLAVYDRSQPPTPFCTYVASSEPANVYGVDSKNITSWFNRRQKWFRWAMQPTKSLENTITNAHYFDQHQPQLSDELLKLVGKGHDGVQIPSGHDVHNNIKVSVGRCLFGPHTSPDGTAINAPQLGLSAPLRAFTTDIPRITPFLRLLRPFPSRAYEQTHVIRLLPSAVHANTLPQLEFEISVRRTRSSGDTSIDLTVDSAKAIFSENSVDYLLPECSVDLRFTRSVFRDLLSGAEGNFSESPGADTFMTAVGSYLEGLFSNASSSNSQNGQSPPPFIHFPVPRSLVRDDAEAGGGNNRQNAKRSDEPVMGEYVFPPLNDLESSCMHCYDFYGEQLNYRFYESGPFLPQHTTDLYLDMDMGGGSFRSVDFDNSREDNIARSDFRSLYKTACTLAFELDRAGRKEED